MAESGKVRASQVPGGVQSWRTSIVSLADHLRQQRGEPIETALSNALDASWKDGWSTLVAQQLSRLKTE